MLLPWQKASMNTVRSVETGSQPSNVESISQPVRAPVQTRTVAVVALAVVVASFALHAGAVFFIPVVASVFLGYALSPLSLSSSGGGSRAHSVRSSRSCW
jgi:hypothetical protein